MQNGDFATIEYVGRVKLTGEVFDLTDENLAKKEGIHDPKQKYGPQLVIIGSGMTVPGVEKQLMKMKPGEEKEFDVPQTLGFGRREPRLIKVVSLQKFHAQKMNPVPGIYVNIDGRNARIQSVSGGRVRIDFNSPLAGKDLHYKVKFVSQIKGTQEKGQALLDHYGMKARVTFNEGILTVTTDAKLPDQVKQALNMQFTKWIKEAKRISYAVPKPTPKGKGKPASKKVTEKKPEAKKEKPKPTDVKRPEPVKA